MNPVDMVQGFADRVTRLFQSYLRFILLSLISPFRQTARQYYRSVRAIEKDVSPIGFMFITSAIIAFVMLGMQATSLAGRQGDNFDLRIFTISISDSATTGAMLPALLASIFFTTSFDFYVRLAYRRSFFKLGRTKRLQAMIMLTSVSALVWTIFSIIFLLLLSSKIPSLSDPGLDNTPDIFLTLVLVLTLVLMYLKFIPLSLYLNKASRKGRTLNRWSRTRCALFPLSIILPIFLATKASIEIDSKLQGTVEVTYSDCNTDNGYIAGQMVIKNATYNDVFFNNLIPVKVDLGGSDAQESPLYIDVSVYGDDIEQDVFIPQGQTKIFDFTENFKPPRNLIILDCSAGPIGWQQGL